ncbi:Acetyltransferase [Alphaproteobacteria bacterium SO-S41]|nr:Acetyltransferase [Alphaproteobacteria bacterium SO-S41]
MTHAIRLLKPEETEARRAALIDILVDSVTHGASVNFVLPMSAEKAAAWWDGALAGHARGERLIFVAEADGRVDGTVQLIPAPQENQPHRADLSKMLVHSRARHQGLGAALMQAAEAEARRIGRTLLTLDTETGSDGERLYTRLGWTKFGEVPGFALTADGNTRQAASFFYKTL